MDTANCPLRPNCPTWVKDPGQVSRSRVSLTYRVKSAHKLKLTDKQLLQWLFPILLIMIIYLSSWTISDPPKAVVVRDAEGLQFRQCEFGWWDHSIAAGELLFLFWGIKVCVNVRNAQTLFDEAKYISWAIYNIAIVNITMAMVHLLVPSGPDVKYLCGFVRTQLSTTTTIALILAPKFYRIAVGLGDEYDARAQARGAAASFYLNGIEPDEEDISIYRENEELKEEVQKLAAQIEFMKIVHMEANNRHLKPRREGYFSQSAPGRRKSSIGAALRLDAYTSVGPDSLALRAGEAPALHALGVSRHLRAAGPDAQLNTFNMRSCCASPDVSGAGRSVTGDSVVPQSRLVQ
ncbi:probable G-protein coupled receptor CG31760 [Pollicipes pollicipes]|uniref:probable G-protein coupled receptor CG31760 n=1 Tax=Pollicipes pollicipes TaxID=41117 RepID=UPI0018850590|nr:probable G-protein coupled receptor CG31760 [Pollicipes pollicipes]